MSETVRSLLERFAASEDPDVRDQAKALLSLLALFEYDPYQSVPVAQIYQVMGRHLLKEDADARPVSAGRRSPERRQAAPPDREAVPRESASDPWSWENRAHVVGKGQSEPVRRKGHRTRD